MRLEKLQQRLRQEQIDSCIISDSASIHYFIDKLFHCGERMVVLLVTQEGKPTLFLNDLFPCEESDEFNLVRFNDTDKAVNLLAERLMGQTVAVDKNFPSGFLLQLMKLKPLHYVDSSIAVDVVRAIKEPSEQNKMREASRLNDAVMEEVRKMIEVGMTEKELEQKINQKFLEITHSEPSFDTIVAFGENGADPHCVPGNKKLEEGMNIIVDMGCRYQGYCSDMTRTFFVGHNPIEEIYNTVLKANLAAIETVKPGVRFQEIDRAAREVIEQAGYGNYFIHRLGHGIGLDVHEPFDVSATNEMVVEEGMCFSIEPGIYLPNQCGVRIEDLVLVTKEGCEVLNHHDKTNPVLAVK